MKLTGRTILITGGASGIGQALARELHARSNTVLIAGRCEDALAEVASAHPGMEWSPLDLTDPERLEIAIDAVPGVVENGICARRRADVVLVGAPQGVRVLRS